MATDSRSYAEGFGQVNKTVGVVFRYVLLASALFGIAMLTVLLAYVANDAIQPFTADPGWHLTYFLAFVLPSLATVGYLYRRDDAGLRVGATVLGFAAVSLLFSGGAIILFLEVIAPLTWFAYLVAVAIPVALTVAVQRYSRRIPFVGRLAAVTAAFYVAVLGVPGPVGTLAGAPQVVPSVAGLILGLPISPLPWILLTLTLGTLAAAAVGGYAARLRDRRTGLLVGLAAVATVAASALVAPAIGLTSVPATIIASMALVPLAGYVGGVGATRPADRVGLALPAVVVGGALVGALVVETVGFAGPQSWLDWQFLTSSHSNTAIEAGIYPAIAGSILLMLTVAALSFPVGVGAALYLEEYAPDNRFTRFIDVNISNLAGVPSVVYGLLGLGLFVTYLGQPAGTVLVGGATLALLILPIVIISAREAIRSVPDEMRQASYGMGATKWQTVKNVILPRSFPGILTGTILALGRAIGETAPLIMIGAPNVLFSFPSGFESKVSAMPLQVYSWASYYATPDFYQKAVPAGVVVLVVVLLAMNSVAIVLRNRYQREA